VESDPLKENAVFADDKIICPIDFSDPSYEGLQSASELAEHFSAELILVHIVSPMPNIAGTRAPTGFHLPTVLKEMEEQANNQIAEDAAQRIRKKVKSRTFVGIGRPADKIVQTAEDETADLIVMATHGQSGWQRFVSGSVTERVVRMSTCPVFVVPAPKES
jgi:nucleotide-binding universal stress UspA family protein